MAIPVMNFPSAGAEDNNGSGLIAGLTSGLQIYSQLLNIMGQPAKAKADAAESQAKLGLVGAQTGLVGAQTGLTEAQTQKALAPDEQKWGSLGQEINDMTNLKAKYGADSPEVAQAQNIIDQKLEAEKAQAAARNTYAKAAPYIYSPAIVKQMGISDLVKNGGWSLNQAQQIKANPELQNTLKPEGTPGDLDRAQQLDSKITKDVTPASIQQAQYAGKRAETILDNIDPLIDQGALDYYGIKGQALKHKDELTAAATGNVPDRLWAHRVMQGQLNAAKDELALTMKVPADQISRGELGVLFDINKYSNNKDAAKAQLASLKNFTKNQENINFSSLSQLAKQHKAIGDHFDKGGTDNLQVNSDQLQSASPGQAKQLGMSSTDIPSFDNSADFKAWFSQLPPDQKAAVRRKLGGQ